MIFHPHRRAGNGTRTGEEREVCDTNAWSKTLWMTGNCPLAFAFVTDVTLNINGDLVVPSGIGTVRKCFLPYKLVSPAGFFGLRPPQNDVLDIKFNFLLRGFFDFNICWVSFLSFGTKCHHNVITTPHNEFGLRVSNITYASWHPGCWNAVTMNSLRAIHT